ncbi:MAG: 50S ribosomal protein L20 [Thermoanaerobaculia bacterium]
MRVKRGFKRKNRRVRILKAAKGFWGMRSKNHRHAKQAVEKALNFAYTGRKDRKGEFRTLWIARINAGARLSGMSYSMFMSGLKIAGSALDRKVLADLAVNDPKGFAALVDMAKRAHAGA